MEDKTEDAKKELGWYNSDIIHIEGGVKSVTLTLGRSAMIGQIIRFASTNVTAEVKEDSICNNTRTFTLKPMLTEDADFEIIAPKQIENKTTKTDKDDTN